MGWFAVGFGFLGIFASIVFVPLGFICSVVAIFVGQGTWAFVGFLLAIAGFITSPIFMGFLGLGALAAWF